MLECSQVKYQAEADHGEVLYEGLSLADASDAACSVSYEVRIWHFTYDGRAVLVQTFKNGRASVGFTG